MLQTRQSLINWIENKLLARAHHSGRKVRVASKVRGSRSIRRNVKKRDVYHDRLSQSRHAPNADFSQIGFPTTAIAQKIILRCELIRDGNEVQAGRRGSRFEFESRGLGGHYVNCRASANCALAIASDESYNAGSAPPSWPEGSNRERGSRLEVASAQFQKT